MNVKGVEVTVSLQLVDDNDFICLTDLAKARGGRSRAADIIKNWIRTRTTLEFLGTWEQLNNSDFNVVEFDHFKMHAGLPSFVLSPGQWIERTNAKGLIVKSGRYGGTYAHKDIAFEFGSAISPVFKLYLIKEYQRLKKDESNRLQLEWNLQRTITKINYRIHTNDIPDWKQKSKEIEIMKHLRKIILVLITNFVFLFALHASSIEANVAVIKLTPPLEMGYTLGGYGARMSRPAEGIHDDIWAKALVLNDGGKKYAIVTLDILGLPPNVKPQVIEKLNLEEWTEENILLLPSHSHTSLEMFALNDKNIFNLAPIGIFQPELLEFVIQSLADLIKSADQDLKPVKIGSLSKQIEGLNRNRRGASFIDKTLTVTRIDHINGKPMTLLVNWTGHPTIMDEHDMLVSGGWPGYLQRELEDWIGQGVVAMFYNGPQGDQSVITEAAGSHYEKAERYGRTMAVNVLDVYNSINPEEQILFNYNHKIIPLPDKEAHPNFMETGGKEYGLDEEKINILLEQVFPAQTSIGACRLGDLLIVGAPGELSAELGLNVKEKLKTQDVPYPVIGGLANQWISYILSENEYQKSGYEASVSFYGKDLGKVIVSGMIETAIPLTE